MELAQAYPRFAERGVELIAISADDVQNALGMADFASATFPILSDSGAAVARSYRVFDLHDDGVAAPATFILNADGEILSVHVGETIAERPTADEMLSQIDELLGR